MGFYQDQVLPRIQDRMMDSADTRQIRARVCAGLSGTVVEVGFGTGLNVPYYPPAVNSVAAVEPSAVCMRIAQPRIAASSTKVALAGLRGESLDLGSGEFDMALSTWTLCSIPDVNAALSEVRRVLKPGGQLYFLEHGHAPDESVARWQTRLEPLWKRLAGGCRLTRQVTELLENAGFRIERLDTYYMKGDLKLFGYTYEGVAAKA